MKILKNKREIFFPWKSFSNDWSRLHLSKCSVGYKVFSQVAGQWLLSLNELIIVYTNTLRIKFKEKGIQCNKQA